MVDTLTRVEQGDVNDLWTLQEASQHTGLTPEGVRQWTKGDPPRVRSERVLQGRRVRVMVKRSDVLREARYANRHAKRAPFAGNAPARGAEPELRDRVSVLEELVRRHALISEHQEEIANHYREIARQRADIEQLLLAPSWVPDR